jgi:hypothetical protein
VRAPPYVGVWLVLWYPRVAMATSTALSTCQVYSAVVGAVLSHNTSSLSATCATCCGVPAANPAAAAVQQPQQLLPPPPPHPVPVPPAVVLIFLSLSGGVLQPPFGLVQSHYVSQVDPLITANITAAVAPAGHPLTLQCWSDAVGAPQPSTLAPTLLPDGHSSFALPPMETNPHLCELAVVGQPLQQKALATLLLVPVSSIAPAQPPAHSGGSPLALYLFGFLAIGTLGYSFLKWTRSERARERQRLVNDFGLAEGSEQYAAF